MAATAVAMLPMGVYVYDGVEETSAAILPSGPPRDRDAAADVNATNFFAAFRDGNTTADDSDDNAQRQHHGTIIVLIMIVGLFASFYRKTTKLLECL